MATPQDLEITRVILDTKRNVITGVKTSSAQNLTQSIGSLI
jgi:hypothetical protein